MLVALCKIDLQFFDTHSLKEKRSQLAHIKNDLRRKFNISVAELAHNDLWQRSQIGAAFIAEHPQSAKLECKSILNFLDGKFNGEVTGYEIEFY